MVGMMMRAKRVNPNSLKACVAFKNQPLTPALSPKGRGGRELISMDFTS
ncbi:hypothetical protein FBY12_3867 [Pseudomonas sp. SJZ131]|nr:hypothetical protein FBY12_3867 [Pseudomonas sp. SJZ131]